MKNILNVALLKEKKKHVDENKIKNKKLKLRNANIILWGSKIWAHDLGPGTTFHPQYARGEEITEDRCD